MITIDTSRPTPYTPAAIVTLERGQAFTVYRIYDFPGAVADRIFQLERDEAVPLSARYWMMVQLLAAAPGAPPLPNGADRELTFGQLQQLVVAACAPAASSRPMRALPTLDG